MVRALPAERAPAGFDDRVIGAARPVERRRWFARRPVLPLGMRLPAQVAALLLVATTAVWVFQRSPELQQAARQEAPVPPASAPPAPAAPATPSPRSSTPAPPAASRDAARQTRTTMKDEAPARADEAAAEAKEKGAKLETIAPREMETRREGDTVGGAAAGAAQSRAAEAPARDRLAKQAAPGLAARTAPADVTGTWRVTDRAAAAAELEALVTRLGGSPITRRTEGDVDIVDFSVPREGYEDLTNVLEWLGRLTVPPPGALPPMVRVSLRITG
jgi:hypothetical protein